MNDSRRRPSLNFCLERENGPPLLFTGIVIGGATECHHENGTMSEVMLFRADDGFLVTASCFYPDLFSKPKIWAETFALIRTMLMWYRDRDSLEIDRVALAALRDARFRDREVAEAFSIHA
jgi:hypothetical protein